MRVDNITMATAAALLVVVLPLCTVKRENGRISDPTGVMTKMPQLPSIVSPTLRIPPDDSLTTCQWSIRVMVSRDSESDVSTLAQKG
jgi:hypothetical protein